MTTVPTTPQELAAIEFAENPDERCACMLVLDTSGSMSGEPVQSLNRGLQRFQDELRKDPLARRRVEVALVTFGQSVRVMQTFSTADRMELPVLEASGMTPMADAVLTALTLLEQRKSEYKAFGIQYYRPWLFLITDGDATDDEALQQQAQAKLREAEHHKRVAPFLVGVNGANLQKLSQWSARPPVKLDGVKFEEMFCWLSDSQKRVAASQPGDQVALPKPNWGTV